MSKFWLSLLFAVCAGALAAECDKIEYAEAKDWTLAELETQACAAWKESSANFSASMDAAKGHSPADPVPRMYLEQSTVCAKQYDLYLRILKNVHHRERPSCK